MKNNSFRFLWIGQTFANCGDVFYLVGLLSILYSVSNSIAITAAVPFTVTISRFLGGLTAPLIIDKYSYKKILVYSQLIKTFFLLILALLLNLFIEDFTSVLFVFPFISIIAFFDGWATPVRNSMVPQLVPEEKIVRTNGFLAVVDQIVQLGSWPVGSIIVSIASGNLLLIFTVILFSISTIMMSLIVFIQENNTKEKLKKTKWSSLQEGWRTIWRTPSLRMVAVVDFFDSIANVVWIAAILLVYVQEVLNKGESWWGYINSAYFAGLLLGGIICMRLEKYIKKYIRFTIFGGSIIVGILTFLFGSTTLGWSALLISILVGIGSEIKMIGQITIIQNHTEKQLLPKVFSARDVILTGMFGISSLVYGVLAEYYGISILFVLSSGILICTGIFSFIMRNSLRFHEPEKSISSKSF